MITAGEVNRARHLLGHVFSIRSHPGRGRGLGHKFTVPTVNLEHYDELVPANGVYITRMKLGAETFKSVTNIGVRPTFGAPSFSIESHLLDFHPVEITADTEIELCFLKRLRNEIKWPDVSALRAQIAKDVTLTQRYFKSMKI
jgi:riboflavin kinase/FMN adenylyltransferase